mmetsp:Transcript_51661/g.172418  ORF Transcript_51661/g.172418 Transcript_51661/m.172418 type:complete len:299 (-) Transcript_51661:541-1437(-)
MLTPRRPCRSRGRRPSRWRSSCRPHGRAGRPFSRVHHRRRARRLGVHDSAGPHLGARDECTAATHAARGASACRGDDNAPARAWLARRRAFCSQSRLWQRRREDRALEGAPSDCQGRGRCRHGGSSGGAFSLAPGHRRALPGRARRAGRAGDIDVKAQRRHQRHCSCQPDRVVHDAIRGRAGVARGCGGGPSPRSRAAAARQTAHRSGARPLSLSRSGDRRQAAAASASALAPLALLLRRRARAAPRRASDLPRDGVHCRSPQRRRVEWRRVPAGEAARRAGRQALRERHLSAGGGRV